jgi:L-amino acid N-acyltransferase YncA
MKKSDLPEAMRIANQNWTGECEWIKKPVFAKVLKDNPKTCWVMEMEGKVIGIRMVKDDFEHRAWGWLLVMKPEYRRNGFGTEFWKETNKVLKKKGYRCLVGVCEPFNKCSVNWHKKLGYKFIGKIPKWFFDNSDSVLFYYRLK